MQRLSQHDIAPYTGRTDLSLDALIDAAESLLVRAAPVQQRKKVTAKPDVRTVRYYTAQGLLPKPLSYDGGRARYGLVHLLRLVFIKVRQTTHHSLRQIRAELDTLSTAEVRALLVEPLAEAPLGPAGTAAAQPVAQPITPMAAQPALLIPLTAARTPDVVPGGVTPTVTPTVTRTVNTVSPSAAPSMHALGHVVVHDGVLSSPKTRAELADALDALAASVRQGVLP